MLHGGREKALWATGRFVSVTVGCHGSESTDPPDLQIGEGLLMVEIVLVYPDFWRFLVGAVHGSSPSGSITAYVYYGGIDVKFYYFGISSVQCISSSLFPEKQ